MSALFEPILLDNICDIGGDGQVTVNPPDIFAVKSTTEPQVKLAQGFNGNDPPSFCITLILVIPLTAIEGTMKEKLDKGLGGVPLQVPIDSLGSKTVF